MATTKVIQNEVRVNFACIAGMGPQGDMAPYNEGSFRARLKKFLITLKIARKSDRESNPRCRAQRQGRNQLIYPTTPKCSYTHQQNVCSQFGMCKYGFSFAPQFWESVTYRCDVKKNEIAQM